MFLVLFTLLLSPVIRSSYPALTVCLLFRAGRLSEREEGVGIVAGRGGSRRRCPECTGLSASHASSAATPKGRMENWAENWGVSGMYAGKNWGGVEGEE